MFDVCERDSESLVNSCTDTDSGGGNEFEHNEKLVAYMIAERPLRACAVLIQMAEGGKFSLDFYC